MHKKFFLPGFLFILVAMITSCKETYAPKPQGYFRIDLPAKSYVKFDTTFPYTFEYPSCARIVPDTRKTSEAFWLNIEYPQFHGIIYISYKPVRGNLVEYLEDTRTFVMKHIPKADAIGDSLIHRPDAKVFGLMYDIEGTGAASPCQFFVTDSTTHFLRGALYFDTSPNNDSLAPVISFIRQDIVHLLQTINWK
jgi:gliding motility-associated lipoprotein GldD